MSPTFQFTVWGIPQPGGSKTAVRTPTFVAMRDANPKAAGWKKQVAQVAGEYMRGCGYSLLHGALEVSYLFYIPRPKYHFNSKGELKEQYRYAYPAKKPDLTKLIRSTEDALKGICWVDDAQVCAFWQTKKVFFETAGVQITIREIEQ